MADAGELLRKTGISTLAQLTQGLRGVFPFLVARLLGEVPLGMLAAGWSWIDLLSKLGIWGLDQATTIQVAGDLEAGHPERARKTLGWALVRGVTRSAAITAVLLGAGYFQLLPGDPGVLAAVTILAWALPFVAAFRIANGASWGAGHLEHAILSKGLTESGVTVGVFLLAWTLGLGPDGPLLAVVAGYVASAAVAGWLAARSLAGERGTGERREGQPPGPALARLAPWIGLSELLYLVNMRMDVLMLSLFAGVGGGVSLATLGAYGLAVEIGFAAKKIRSVFEPIFLPRLAAAAAGDSIAAARPDLDRIRQWMLVLQLGAAGTIALAAPALLSLFGGFFLVAVPWTLLLLLANVLNGLLFSESACRVLAPRASALLAALGAGANLALNLVLIPRLGATGAALATALSYGGQSAARLVLLHREGLDVPARVLGPLLPAAVLLSLFGTAAWLTAAAQPGVAWLWAVLYCGFYFAWSVGGRRKELLRLVREVRHSRNRAETPEGTDPR